MLVAPAGYGKTTLARQWLAGRSGLMIQVTASPASADVAVLFGDLCRALGRAAPGADDRLRERLAVTADPEAEWSVLVEILLEDLASLASEPILVVDDYHALADSEIAEAILGRIVQSGACSTLIVSRTRPELGQRSPDSLWRSPRTGPKRPRHDGRGGEFCLRRKARVSAQAWCISLKAGRLCLRLLPWRLSPPFPDLGDALPESCTAFFAEELFQCLDVPVQQGLTRIALAGIDDVATAREFFDDVDAALEQAVSVGLDQSSGAGRRSSCIRFCVPSSRAKLERDEPEEFRAACETTAALLIERGRWDEAARLISDSEHLFAAHPASRGVSRVAAASGKARNGP